MKRKIALLLSMALLLSGCSENTAPSNTSLTTTTPPTAPTTTTTATTEEEPLKLDKKLTYLMWTGLDLYDETLKLFEEKYGVPEKGNEGYGEYADSAINLVLFGDRMEVFSRLSKMTAAGNPPDICSVDPVVFLYNTNLLESVDSAIDFNDSKWDGVKDVNDSFIRDEKHYVATVDSRIQSYVWYRTSVIEDAGLEDPYELYKNGEWTWSKFEKMCKSFADSEHEKYGYYGYDASSSFAATTGTPFVSLEGKNVKFNLYSKEIESAMSFVEGLLKIGCRTPSNIQWFTSMSYMCDKAMLFYIGGPGVYSDFKKQMSYNNDENDIFAVPLPKPDSDSENYQNICYTAFSRGKGATSDEAFAAWVDCVYETYHSYEEVMFEGDEMSDYIKEYDSEYIPVYNTFSDSVLGGTSGYYAGLGNNLYDCMIRYPAENPEYSFTEMREKYSYLYNGYDNYVIDPSD